MLAKSPTHIWGWLAGLSGIRGSGQHSLRTNPWRPSRPNTKVHHAKGPYEVDTPRLVIRTKYEATYPVAAAYKYVLAGTKDPSDPEHHDRFSPVTKSCHEDMYQEARAWQRAACVAALSPEILSYWALGATPASPPFLPWTRHAFARPRGR